MGINDWSSGRKQTAQPACRHSLSEQHASAGFSGSESSANGQRCMVEQLPIPRVWLLHAESVIGYQHQQHGQTCQDSSCYSNNEENGLYALSVADGHGSVRSVNSRIGSAEATRRSIARLLAFGQDSLGEPPARVEKLAKDVLARNIVQHWVKGIQQRTKRTQEAELPLPSLLMRYGTTLLAVLVTPDYVLYLQLGDGDILCVASDGTVRRPIPKNPAFIADETYSLCMVDRRTGQPNAWMYADVRVEPLQEPPALILLATDGYANSFQTDQDFLKVGTDILAMIRQDGWTSVKARLGNWLAETSRLGSGDDITVGLMYLHGA